MTLGGVLPEYVRNVTLNGMKWFLWNDTFNDFDQSLALCEKANGSLANINSKPINDLIGHEIKVTFHLLTLVNFQKG